MSAFSLASRAAQFVAAARGQPDLISGLPPLRARYLSPAGAQVVAEFAYQLARSNTPALKALLSPHQLFDKIHQQQDQPHLNQLGAINIIHGRQSILPNQICLIKFASAHWPARHFERNFSPGRGRSPHAFEIIAGRLHPRVLATDRVVLGKFAALSRPLSGARKAKGVLHSSGVLSHLASL